MINLLIQSKLFLGTIVIVDFDMVQGIIGHKSCQ